MIGVIVDNYSSRCLYLWTRLFIFGGFFANPIIFSVSTHVMTGEFGFIRLLLYINLNIKMASFFIAKEYVFWCLLSPLDWFYIIIIIIL